VSIDTMGEILSYFQYNPPDKNIRIK